MLGLSTRAVGFYAAFAFPLALFCAIPYFDDDANPDRRSRSAALLVLLSPLHVMFPLTALGIIQHLDKHGAATDESARRSRSRVRSAATAGIALSAAIFVVLARDT